MREYVFTGSVDFSDALVALKNGMAVTRVGWSGRGMYLLLQTPDEHNKMTLPYIYMKTACGNLVPWLASQTDLLADDWERVPLTSDPLTSDPLT